MEILILDTVAIDLEPFGPDISQVADDVLLILKHQPEANFSH